MADFDPPFASSAVRRAPTVEELQTGFGCGPADKQLFDFLIHQYYAELGHLISYAGLTGSNADYEQVRKAIEALIARNALIPLTSDITLYVRTDGNDANDGSANTAASAFRSVNGAILWVMRRYNITGRTVTIQLGNTGTHTPVLVYPNSAGMFKIVGNTANPTQYIFNSVGGSAAIEVAKGQFIFAGVMINCPATGVATGLNARIGSQVGFDRCAWAAQNNNAQAKMINIQNGAEVSFAGPQSVQTGGYCFINLDGGLFAGATPADPSVITTAGPWAQAFLVGVTGRAKFDQITFAGGSTGKRYDLYYHTLVETGGSGANFLPGSIAGTLNNYAVYN